MGDPYSNLQNRLVCFTKSNSNWPLVGIVKSTYTKWGVLYAQVEADRKDPRILKWIKNHIFDIHDDKKYYHIPAERLRILQDVSVETPRLPAEAASRKPAENTYERLGFETPERVVDRIDWLRTGDMVVWIGLDASKDFSKPPDGEVKRIITRNSTTLAWVDFTEPAVFLSKPECSNYGCKKGHGVLVNVDELLPFEAYESMIHINKQNLNAESTQKSEPEVGNLIDIEPEHQHHEPNTKHKPEHEEDVPMETDATAPPLDILEPDLFPSPRFSEKVYPECNLALVPLHSTIVKLDEFQPVFGTMELHACLNGEQYVGIKFESPVTENFSHLKAGQSILPFEHGANCGFLIRLTHLLTSSTFEVHASKSVEEAGAVDFPEFPIPEEELEPALEFGPFFGKINQKTSDTYVLGIQGQNNSCYIDCSLFCFFAFSSSFDVALQPNRILSKTQENARQLIKHFVVNPLRRDVEVPSRNVGYLRTFLTPLKEKVADSEMDMEDFLTFLFEDVMNLKPFLSYTHEAEDYLHSIALHDEDFYEFRTAQFLVNHSFQVQGIRLRKIPMPALILQMPVCNGKMVNGKYIIPNLVLNLSDVLDSSDGVAVELTSVICLASNHYTCFVKLGKGAMSHWVYFDSSPSTGVPQIRLLYNLPETLSSMEKCLKRDQDPIASLNMNHPESKLAIQLLTQCYVLIYTPTNT